MSLKDIETFHPEHAKLKRQADLIEIMSDEHELKLACIASAGADGSYLELPLCHVRDDKAVEAKLYNTYVKKAFLPEHIVSDAKEEMIGICFKSDAIINLPEKIKHLESHANNRGDSLIAVANSIVRDLISTSMAGISADFSKEENKSRIFQRPSESFVNWRSNSEGYTMLVFAESYTNSEGEIKDQRRHFSIESGTLAVTIYRQEDNGQWAEFIETDGDGDALPLPTQPNNKPYDYIPVRVARTPKPALLGMARTVLKGFEVSADYYGMIHKFTSTFVLKTDKTAEKLSVGFENGIKIGKDDDAELLQQGADGVAPQKNEMSDLFGSAIDQGVRLISSGGSAEAQGALYLRNANKQIKMDAVADEASKQIAEALRIAAILEGAKPDEVKFKLKVELIQAPVDAAELKEMREAVVDSQLVKHSDYLLKMESSNLVTLERKEDGSFDTKKYIDEARAEFKEVNEAAEQV